MITTQSTIGWDKGQYAVLRQCDHASGQRSAECARDGWHMVASSDDREDAAHESDRLRSETGRPHKILKRW